MNRVTRVFAQTLGDFVLTAVTGMLVAVSWAVTLPDYLPQSFKADAPTQ